MIEQEEKYTERIRNIIFKNKLFFSSAFDFNDPFETAVKISEYFDESEYESYIEDIYNIYNNRNITLGEFKELALNQSYDTRRQRIANTLRLHSQEIYYNWGICCFSEENDNMLLFSHYASDHKGLCFEFKTDRDERLGKIQKVKYKRKFPDDRYVVIHNDHSKLGDLLLLTKSKDWKYEKEWRLSGQNYMPGVSYPFNPEALTGIIFGCRAGYRLKNIVRDLIGKRDKPINLYEARMKNRAFGLDIVPLD